MLSIRPFSCGYSGIAGCILAGLILHFCASRKDQNNTSNIVSQKYQSS